MKNVPVKLLS